MTRTQRREGVMAAKEYATQIHLMDEEEEEEVPVEEPVPVPGRR
jgi:hypothetical protein